MRRLDINQACRDALSRYGLGGLDLRGAACYVFEQGETLFQEGDELRNL